MKILLLGRSGQIGWELHRALAPLGAIIAPGREELDLTDGEAIRHSVRTLKPALIVNAAAYTIVDRAEEEPELAMAVNGTAPGILAEEARLVNAAIVHYSTDYVFDGEKCEPYTEADTPNPVNTYGKTKLAGERAVQAAGAPYFIFRTGWVYGLRGRNFMLTVLKMAREQDELRIVCDQIGSPTWSRMIAEATSLVLMKSFSSLNEYKGIYHLSAGGETSWYGFAKMILAQSAERGSKINKIVPISTSDFKSLARRPLYSVLANQKLTRTFNITLPEWDYCLRLALNDKTGNEVSR